ncbi:MAG: hypothetical protein PWQ18_1351, partial [Clostridia bacterium]|nr:hypothetical protein [Clostridia bacterium]
VGISFHGTRAEVAVVEKAAPPQQEPFDRPASIIAARDGVIKDILVINGEARVKAGDTVRQGEILISGLILPPPPPEKQPGEAAEPPRPQPQPRLVRARGIVRARVWYEIEREINRLQVQEVPTGRQQTTIAIQTPKGRYYLKGPARPPYTNCHQKNRVMALPAWRNLSLPVELIITTYAEIQISQRQLTYTEAVDTAGQMALQELKAKLPPGAGVTAQKVIPLSPPDAAIVRVRAWLETEEDIGQAVPLEARQPPLR